MLKITIPTPCHEAWEAMTANPQGRHCIACDKTVVDFTVMSDEEVKYFLLRQQEKTTCGRFKQEQLHRITVTLPKHILQIHLPLWKQFLTACLLAFSSMLFSCNAVIDKGNNQTYNPIELNIQDEIPVPGWKEFDGRVGMFSIRDSVYNEVDSIKACTSTEGEVRMIETYTQGITVVEPVPPEQIVEELIPLTLGTDSVDKKDERISLINDSTKTKTKKPVKMDSTDCNNMKYY